MLMHYHFIQNTSNNKVVSEGLNIHNNHSERNEFGIYAGDRDESGMTYNCLVWWIYVGY